MEKGAVLYKVLVVGDVGVGKTSIVKRNVRGKFSNTKPTIGVDFVLKEVPDVIPNTLVRLQLWDVAGQERFKSLTRVYYKGATAAIVVFDSTSKDTLDGVEEWKQDLDEKVELSDGQPIPCILLANKADLNSRFITENDLKKFAAKNNFAACFFTSAKTGLNIEESTEWLVKHVHEVTTKSDSKKSPVASKARPETAPAAVRPVVLGGDAMASRTYKLLIMGAAKVGKHSLVRSYAGNSERPSVSAKDALEITVKKVETPAGPIKLELWTIPTKLKPALVSSYFTGAHGAFFVYDATDFRSLAAFSELRATFLENCGKAKLPPCVVLANKTDLPTATLMTPKEVSELLAEHAFIHYYDTSAVAHKNVGAAVSFMYEHILDKYPTAGTGSHKSSKTKNKRAQSGGCC